MPNASLRTSNLRVCTEYGSITKAQVKVTELFHENCDFDEFVIILRMCLCGNHNVVKRLLLLLLLLLGSGGSYRRSIWCTDICLYIWGKKEGRPPHFFLRAFLPLGYRIYSNNTFQVVINILD